MSSPWASCRLHLSLADVRAVLYSCSAQTSKFSCTVRREWPPKPNPTKVLQVLRQLVLLCR